MADEESKIAFAALLKAILTGDMGYVRLSEYTQYKDPLARPREGDVVIDGGIDLSSEHIFFARDVGPKGMVYCFEPNLLCMDKIFENVEKHALTDRIKVIPCGLFSHKCEKIFQLDGARTRIAKEGSPPKNKNGNVLETMHCPVTDPDSFVKERGLKSVDVIKDGH